MSDSGAPLPWSDVVEALHALLAALVARTQYPAGHPAIARADETAAAVFRRVHEKVGELVVALVDGELVVAERPMPELFARLPALVAAYERHGIECLVFTRGVDQEDLAGLATALSQPSSPNERARARDAIRTSARHVLVRFVDLLAESAGVAGGEGVETFAPEVLALLASIVSAVRGGARVDLEAVRGVSRRILARVAARDYRLLLRSHDEAAEDGGAGALEPLAAHSSNVAMMTAAMLLDSGLPPSSAVDGVGAALLHDVGLLLLPTDVRGKPEPLLDARGKRLFQYHPFLGARALLAGGSPSLWVAAALEHHRGVDGQGYPALRTSAPAHEAVAMIALASFVDTKRASIAGAASTPDDALGQALSLAGRYFDAATLTLFMRALGVYPPGTVVELSDGAYAVVTRANPNDPRRPEVELLLGPNAHRRFGLSDLDGIEQRYTRSIVRAVPPPLVPATDDDDADAPADGAEA